MNHQEHLGQMIEEVAGIAIFSVDSTGKILEWNRACESLFGYTKEESLGQLFHELIAPQHQKESFAKDIQSNISYTSQELEFSRKDGSLFYALTNSTFVGERCYFMIFEMGTNSPKHSIRKLVDPEQISAEKLIVLSFDKAYHITSFNTFARQSMGYSEREVLGKNFLELLVPESFREKIKWEVSRISKDRRSQSRLHFPILTKSGQKRVIRWEKVVQSKQGEELSYHLIGVSDSENQEKLNFMENYDDLTNLPNQHLVYRRIDEAMGRAVRLKQNLAVIFLDIQNFKSINHIFGFHFGNEILKMVANRLSSSLRDYDTVARFSGDEFVLFFENIQNDNDAKLLAKRIEGLFEKPFELEGNEIELEIVQGLALFPSDGNSAIELVKNANLAMDFAKKQQKSCQIYSPIISDELTNKAILERSLKQAIERGEFFVKYQPQVDTKTQKIIGAEALIRWEHPQLQLIPPLDFIPLAEDTGLIHKIGKFVLKEAITQAKQWHDAGYKEFKISVNLSAVQLLQSNILESVYAILDEVGFDASYLELEITESALMQNIDRVAKVMQQLKERGVKFAIDDFGTGYSSFNYLNKLPLDAIKIDKSFIDHIALKKSDLVIVNAIVSMGHSLGLNLIAEGVEKEEQYAKLQEIECDVIQGYYFSKPVDPDKMLQLLQEGIAKIEENRALDYEMVTDLKEYKR